MSSRSQPDRGDRGRRFRRSGRRVPPLGPGEVRIAAGAPRPVRTGQGSRGRPGGTPAADPRGASRTELGRCRGSRACALTATTPSGLPRSWHGSTPNATAATTPPCAPAVPKPLEALRCRRAPRDGLRRRRRRHTGTSATPREGAHARRLPDAAPWVPDRGRGVRDRGLRTGRGLRSPRAAREPQTRSSPGSSPRARPWWVSPTSDGARWPSSRAHWSGCTRHARQRDATRARFSRTTTGRTGRGPASPSSTCSTGCVATTIG